VLGTFSVDGAVEVHVELRGVEMWAQRILVVGVTVVMGGCAMSRQLGKCPLPERVKQGRVFDAVVGSLTGLYVLANTFEVLSPSCSDGLCRRKGASQARLSFKVSILSALFWKSAASDDFRNRACPLGQSGNQKRRLLTTVPAPRVGARAVRPAVRDLNPKHLGALPGTLHRAVDYPVRFVLEDGDEVAGILRLFNGLVAVVETASGRLTIGVERVQHYEILRPDTAVSTAELSVPPGGPANPLDPRAVSGSAGSGLGPAGLPMTPNKSESMGP